MKQLYRDQIPDDLKAELQDVRFVKLGGSPFKAEIIAKGDDPNIVNQMGPGGVLFRIDEREKSG